MRSVTLTLHYCGRSAQLFMITDKQLASLYSVPCFLVFQCVEFLQSSLFVLQLHVLVIHDYIALNHFKSLGKLFWHPKDEAEIAHNVSVDLFVVLRGADAVLSLAPEIL